MEWLFNRNRQAEKDITAPCSGRMIAAKEIKDPVFSGEMVGKTVGIVPDDGKIVSPASGVLESVFPTGHAFTVRMQDGTGLMVHIGIDTVEMKGAGFRVVGTAGQKIKAGDPVVEVDLEEVKKAGHDDTVILVIAEPAQGKEYAFREPGKVKAGESVLRK